MRQLLLQNKEVLSLHYNGRGSQGQAEFGIPKIICQLCDVAINWDFLKNIGVQQNSLNTKQRQYLYYVFLCQKLIYTLYFKLTTKYQNIIHHFWYGKKDYIITINSLAQSSLFHKIPYNMLNSECSYIVCQFFLGMNEFIQEVQVCLLFPNMISRSNDGSLDPKCPKKWV